MEVAMMPSPGFALRGNHNSNKEDTEHQSGFPVRGNDETDIWA